MENNELLLRFSSRGDPYHRFAAWILPSSPRLRHWIRPRRQKTVSWVVEFSGRVSDVVRKLPLDPNNPWKNEGFSPKTMG